MNVRRETLICDTSFVGHFLRLKRWPDRYAHWNEDYIARIRAAVLAISIVTIAELRAGYIDAGWGSRRIAAAERRWAEFTPVLIDDPYLNAWAGLWSAAKARGVAISDNDLWIAATAAVRRQTLVTCDRDHVRLAPELPIEVLFFAPPV
jgi:predicted nucleic acid-binding protein